jgi:monofunctional biosynthetic peptidoglycan transglycosylase
VRVYLQYDYLYLSIFATGAWDMNLFHRDMPWFSIDDSIIGGVSKSNATTVDRYALLFWGDMPVASNSGFASIHRQLYLSPDQIPSDAYLKIAVTGDGRTYKIMFLTAALSHKVLFSAYIDTIPNETVTHILSLSDFKVPSQYKTGSDYKPFSWQDVQQMGFMLCDRQSGKFGLKINNLCWQTANGV